MRRFTRLTNGFSKKVENLAHAVSLHFMHYNFCRPHQTLTKREGRPFTPAMAEATGRVSVVAPPADRRLGGLGAGVCQSRTGCGVDARSRADQAATSTFSARWSTNSTVHAGVSGPGHFAADPGSVQSGPHLSTRFTDRVNPIFDRDVASNPKITDAVLDVKADAGVARPELAETLPIAIVSAFDTPSSSADPSVATM